MLHIPFIYLSLYNCRECNLHSSQSPWRHMLNTQNMLLTNYKCFVLRMFRIHKTRRTCSKHVLYYSFARLLSPWPLFALLWHRYSVEKEGIWEAHWTKHQVLRMTTTTEESRSPMVRYDYNSKQRLIYETAKSSSLEDCTALYLNSLEISRVGRRVGSDTRLAPHLMRSWGLGFWSPCCCVIFCIFEDMEGA